MNLRFLSFLPYAVVVAACYFTAEFYPLSSFPMYSKFDSYTYYTYLQDADGKGLPTVTSTGVYSSVLKKRYGAELDELKAIKKYKGSHYDWSIERKTEAGQATIEWLKEYNTVPEGAELVDVRIFLRDGKIVKEESVVGKN